MTPREISLLLIACRARMQHRENERFLLMRAMALAYHAPEKLPSPPVPILPPGEMTDDEIKQRLLAWRGKEKIYDP